MEEEEVTSRVEGKIQVIRGPLPPSNLWSVVAELERAASAEDPDLALLLLRKLVPTYRLGQDAATPISAAVSF